MPRALHLTSVDNPRIKAVVKLREHRHRRESGLFIAEGHREVRRAMQAGLKIVDIFGCESLWDAPVGEDDTASDHVSLSEFRLWQQQGRAHTVSEAVMEKMRYGENHSCVLAVCEMPGWSWPVEACGTDELWLVAVGINKPGNLGAMARSASAAGATGLIVVDAPIDAFNPNAIRASTGAVFTLPVLAMSSAQAIERLTQRGVKIIAAVVQASTVYTQVSMREACALVIGSEEHGLPECWREFLQPSTTPGIAVTIPMQKGVVDSLNASVTAGLLLFEARRQRQYSDDSCD